MYLDGAYHAKKILACCFPIHEVLLQFSNVIQAFLLDFLINCCCNLKVFSSIQQKNCTNKFGWQWALRDSGQRHHPARQFVVLSSDLLQRLPFAKNYLSYRNGSHQHAATADFSPNHNSKNYNSNYELSSLSHECVNWVCRFDLEIEVKPGPLSAYLSSIFLALLC